jgi:uncharacterized protein (TIGR00725 family)
MTTMRMPLISVIGSSRCGPELSALAEKAGTLLAEAGVGIVSGGGGGVMEAVCRGAAGAGGVTIGILAEEEQQAANRYVRFAIPTGIGEARNAIVVRAGSAVLAIGGGYGTLSEIAFALKWGKPVIGLRTWEAVDSSGQQAAVDSCGSVEEAVRKLVTTIENEP